MTSVPILYYHDACFLVVASCSVSNVAHEPHDWLARLGWDVDGPMLAWCDFTNEWRHCEGVSGSERRAAGASTPPATAPLLSSLRRDARESGNAVGVGQEAQPLRQQRDWRWCLCPLASTQ